MDKIIEMQKELIALVADQRRYWLDKAKRFSKVSMGAAIACGLIIGAASYAGWLLLVALPPFTYAVYGWWDLEKFALKTAKDRESDQRKYRDELDELMKIKKEYNEL